MNTSQQHIVFLFIFVHFILRESRTITIFAKCVTSVFFVFLIFYFFFISHTQQVKQVKKRKRIRFLQFSAFSCINALIHAFTFFIIRGLNIENEQNNANDTLYITTYIGIYEFSRYADNGPIFSPGSFIVPLQSRTDNWNLNQIYFH